MSKENQDVIKNDIFTWIEEELKPEFCTSENFIYNEMESQSDYSLPVIYQDFDDNVSFISYKAGSKLPFEDNSFDGILAASSIEQTPDPKATLYELYRILKPGGKIRIFYEALSNYKDGYENDIWIVGLTENRCKLVLFDRNIENEFALQYGLTIAMAEKDLKTRLVSNSKSNSENDDNVRFEQVSVSFLVSIKELIIKAQVCKTVHPSGKTWSSWLKEAGFRKVLPTYSGGSVAYKLFDTYTEYDRPSDLKSVDDAIKKVVKIVTELEAPIELDPMITAVK